MKKYYSEPEMIVRNYKLIPGNVILTSNPGDTNLNDGDDENPWANGGNGAKQAPLFNE